MSTTRFLAVLAGVSLATSTFALPAPPPAAAAGPVPFPAVVVNPTRLPLSFSGATVTIDFKLDVHGKPHDIRVLAVNDAQLVRQIKAAFCQWTFAPAPDQKRAEEKRFVLPLEIKL